jgi:leucyl/phenylalanyl-tRNA---protein transferase
MSRQLTPELLVNAYASGIFPMADDDDRIIWFSPEPRAILELDSFTVSRSLRARCRKGEFDLAINRDFAAVIDACADRPEGTWINADIRFAYVELHRLGFAHSVESWQDGRLVGGLYGVALGGAFFGESMFHRATDASKVALVHLVERLRQRGYVLLDVQFTTPHLAQFCCTEIPRQEYLARLHAALRLDCRFVDG